MLVIINPVATKMSDAAARASSSTRCRAATTSRRVDTDAKGHAIELCREAAAAGLRRRRRLRRRRHGQRGRQRPGRLADRADLPARRLQQRRRQAARHPDRRGRRHRAPAAPGRPLGAAHGRPRARQRPLLHVRRRHGPGRQRRRARGLQPAPEEALRPVLLRRVRDRHVPAQATSSTRRGCAVEVDGRTVEASRLFVQNAENYTYFNDRAGAAGRGRALRLRQPGRRRADPRAALRRADRHLPRAVGRRADRQAPRRSTPSARSTRPSCAPPTTARSRSRSTATTSTTCSRRASASRRARCTSSRRSARCPRADAVSVAAGMRSIAALRGPGVARGGAGRDALDAGPAAVWRSPGCTGMPGSGVGR